MVGDARSDVSRAGDSRADASSVGDMCVDVQGRMMRGLMFSVRAIDVRLVVVHRCG